MIDWRPAAVRWAVWVLLAALAGFFVRLAWIDQRLRETPRRSGWRAQAPLDAPLAGVAWLHDEQLYYLSTAVNKYQGRGFFPDYNRIRDGVFVPPPLQSVLILAVFRAASGLVSPFTLLALQACAAALMVVLVAEWGRRLASPGAGLLCAWLVALHPDYVQWSGYLLTESNYVAGFALVALLLTRWAEKPTLAFALGASLALGLLNLQRPNALWLPPLLAVFAIALLGPRRRGLAAAAAFLLVPLLVLLPWRQRNMAASGEPIWVSSNTGVYLYIANNPKLDVLATPYMDAANRGGRLLQPQIEGRLRAPDGRLRVTYHEYSKAYRAALLTYVERRPMHFLRNYAAKFVLQFWLVPEPGPVANGIGIPPALYTAARRGLVAFGLLGLAATLVWRRTPAALASALLLAYFAAAGGLAGTDLSGRYALVPHLLLMMFAAAGLAKAHARFRGAAQDSAAASSGPAVSADSISSK